MSENQIEIPKLEEITPHLVKVPKKKPDETYVEREHRVAAHNSNFMIEIEPRVKKWSEDHNGERPPIAKDSEGKFFWVSRKSRRLQQSRKYKNKIKK